MQRIIGTCSECRGRVCLPDFYWSVIPPVPRCIDCGATVADYGPVIPMRPRSKEQSHPGWRYIGDCPEITFDTGTWCQLFDNINSYLL